MRHSRRLRALDLRRRRPDAQPRCAPAHLSRGARESEGRGFGAAGAVRTTSHRRGGASRRRAGQGRDHGRGRPDHRGLALGHRPDRRARGRGDARRRLHREGRPARLFPLPRRPPPAGLHREAAQRDAGPGGRGRELRPGRSAGPSRSAGRRRAARAARCRRPAGTAGPSRPGRPRRCAGAGRSGRPARRRRIGAAGAGPCAAAAAQPAAPAAPPAEDQ